MWAKQIKPSRRVAGHELAGAPTEITRDPVCGMPVAGGSRQFAYRERSFLFCGFPCLDRFREEPEVFRRRKEARRASAGLPTTVRIVSMWGRP